MHVVRIEPENKRIGFTQKNLGITHPTAMPAPDVLLRGAADD